jgi:hypothetical protein
MNAITPEIEPPAPLALVPTSAESLIAKAIERQTPVETMEKLLVMRRELRAEAAKSAFDAALAAFQAECPVIHKSKEIRDKSGKVRYSYAPIEVIVQQVRPLLQKHGFSYTTDAIVEDGWVTAQCTSTHSAGHSETKQFKVPVDKDAFMSAPQRFASALTFAKRYAFCNAFGILTGDQDDDNSIAVPEEAPRPNPAPPPKKAPITDEEKMCRFLKFTQGYHLELAEYARQQGWITTVQAVGDIPVERLPKTVAETTALMDTLKKMKEAADQIPI